MSQVNVHNLHPATFANSIDKYHSHSIQFAKRINNS